MRGEDARRASGVRRYRIGGIRRPGIEREIERPGVDDDGRRAGEQSLQRAALGRGAQGGISARADHPGISGNPGLGGIAEENRLRTRREHGRSRSRESESALGVIERGRIAQHAQTGAPGSFRTEHCGAGEGSRSRTQTEYAAAVLVIGGTGLDEQSGGLGQLPAHRCSCVAAAFGSRARTAGTPRSRGAHAPAAASSMERTPTSRAARVAAADSWRAATLPSVHLTSR